jgi:hypothetical protein
MEIESSCPYCGESVSVWVDEGGGRRQSYVEDCPVCCRPWQVEVLEDGEGGAEVSLGRLDD